MTAITEERREAWELQEGDEIAPGLSALRLLGGGSRYEAYLAFDERLHHVVVAKVLRPGGIGDGSALRGLRSEADVLTRLNHPAIARLFRSGIDEERPHVVLEHVEGPRLSTLIRRFGPLESEQAAPLAVEIASALHYMHGLGLVHLDVKPKNLMMAAPPRLIDLSIARSFDAAAEVTVPIGTDAYMAPEQAKASRGLVGPPADVWALGVTLYEALAGKPAFPRGSHRPEASVEERLVGLGVGLVLAEPWDGPTSVNALELDEAWREDDAVEADEPDVDDDDDGDGTGTGARAAGGTTDDGADGTRDGDTGNGRGTGTAAGGTDDGPDGTRDGDTRKAGGGTGTGDSAAGAGGAFSAATDDGGATDGGAAGGGTADDGGTANSVSGGGDT